MNHKLTGRLASGVFAAFIVALAAGVLLPVYTDEVGWRFHERAGIDGVDKLLADLCGINTLARPPWFVMPVRHYSALFNTAFADPFWVRISGVLYALIGAGLLYGLVKRLARSAADWTVLTIFGFGMLGLGVLPYQLVTSRPEQPILLVTLGALLLAFGSGSGGKGGKDTPATTPDSSAARAWLVSLVLLVLTVIAYSYHFKAILLTPVYLACLTYASKGRAAIAPRVVAGGLMFAAALAALRYWLDRLACPDYPPLTAAYAKSSLGVLLLQARSLSDVLAVIGQALENVSITRYIAHSVVHPVSMSNWLPKLALSKQSAFLMFLPILLGWVAAATLAVSAAARSQSENGWLRWPEKRIVLALGLVTTVVVWSATQPMSNFYEASFVLPLAVLAILLAISANDGLDLTAGRRAGLAVAMAVLALGNMTFSVLAHSGKLYHGLDDRGYVDGQEFSVGNLGYSKAKPEILKAARLCGIAPERKPQGLLLDDVTYFTFMESRLPHHRLGIISGADWSPPDPLGYLRSKHSDGVITSCSALPPSMRAKAKSHAGFCCIAKDDL